MFYRGQKQKRYELGKRIGGGGEGSVYEIVGCPDKLAKIYTYFNTPAERNEKYEKIRAMLTMNLPSTFRGRILLAWPMDTLSDQNGDFCGYVMPRVRDKKALYCAFLPSERTKLFGANYSWRWMPRLAFNLATMVESLHKVGVVLGDMNADNFLVDKDGYVTLIDTDSYTITVNGKTFKCKAAMGDVLAPELQGKNLGLDTSVFTKESDCFALAVHLWQILNNGVHPFGLPPSTRGSSCANPTVTNIASGHSVFSAGAVKNVDQPDLNMLPAYILDLFKRAFQYNAYTALQPAVIHNRPTAAEFAKALKMLIAEPTVDCSHHHTYLRSCSRCPWCEIERGSNLPPQHMPRQTNVAPQNTCTSFPASVGNATNAAPCKAKRSRKPLLVWSLICGCIFLLLHYADFAVGIEHTRNVATTSFDGFLALAAITGFAVTVVYHVFGKHYERAADIDAWRWLLASLFTPLLIFLFAYAALMWPWVESLYIGCLIVLICRRRV